MPTLLQVIKKILRDVLHALAWLHVLKSAKGSLFVIEDFKIRDLQEQAVRSVFQTKPSIL